MLVFVVGTGSLGAEIAAVRLLAPYFGASTIVWANTIGVVLVALSVGLLARRPAGGPPPATCAASACCAAHRGRAARGWCPFAADPLLDVAVDALDEISAGAFLGSLVARAGAGGGAGAAARARCRPGRSAWRCQSVEEAGTVAGRLYALSTAGSLVGTLLSALLLIPLVGTRRTFLIFALAIAVVAVLGLRPVRRYALAPAVIAALIALPVGTLKAETDDGAQ